MSIERRPSRKKPTLSKSSVDKYHIAQQYLFHTNFDTIIHALQEFQEGTGILFKPYRERYRNAYIALIQSITFEQEREILHSQTTLKAIRGYLELFRIFLRMQILDHIEFEQISTYVMRYAEQVPSETIRTVQEAMEYGSWGRTFWMAQHWDTLVEPMYGWYEEALTHAPGIGDLDKKWVHYEKEITEYLKGEKETNPIILFDQIRNLEHHSGTILQPWFWSFSEIAEIKPDEPSPFIGRHYAWIELGDHLSKDPFVFDLPYKFGYNGRNKT
jgi:hypothetical protein